MNLLRTAALAAVLLAGATAAHADEIRLDDRQLDAVSAGFGSLPIGSIGGYFGDLPLPSLGNSIGNVSERVYVAKVIVFSQLGWLPMGIPYGAMAE